MNHIAQVLELISSGLSFGELKSSGPLTLLPLTGAAPAKDYLLAADAIAEGLLSLTELGSGSVPEVAALNEAELPVLLLDGEHIEGAKQSRVLNSTALIGAGRKTVLPVSCVEHGRWAYSGDSTSDFQASPDFSYSRLRARNAAAIGGNLREGLGHRTDQGEVWDEVALKHREVGVAASDSGALRDAFETRRSDLEGIIRAFPLPDPGQTGVLACVGGRPVAMDLFDKPETLDKLWTRLINGYALDAVTEPEARMQEGSIDAFFTSAARANVTTHEGIGLGMDVVLTGRSVVGHALVWDGGIVHVALFSSGGQQPHATGDSIATPSRRRQLPSRLH